MEITSDDRMIDICCLPDNALCKLSGKSPDNMDACPGCYFDSTGDICVPGLCDYYAEE